MINPPLNSKSMISTWFVFGFVSGPFLNTLHIYFITVVVYEIIVYAISGKFKGTYNLAYRIALNVVKLAGWIVYKCLNPC